MTVRAPTAAWLALGSNVGDRESHLVHALRRFACRAELTGVSTVYESEPVGYRDQPPFLNLVVRVRTTRSPRELLDLALEIEGERGRERSFTGAPRTLDIDLVLYGEREVREPGLTVPHPRMRERPFVLVPLLELDPGVVEPGTGRPYDGILADLRAAPSGAVGGAEGHAGAGPLGLRRIMAGEELLDDGQNR